MRGELVRCHRERRGGQRREAVLHLLREQRLVDLGVQLRHDLLRRARRCGDAEPCARVEPGQACLGHRGEVGHRGRALQARHGDALEASRLHVRHRCDGDCEHHLHLPADQVGKGGCIALVRHVRDLDAGALLQHLAREVAGVAAARRGEVDLARVGLEVGDQFTQRIDGDGRVHDQQVRHVGDEGHGHEVAARVERQVAVQGGVDRYGGRGYVDDGVAVRWGAHGGFDADVAARTRAVVDDHRLPEGVRELLAYRTRKRVGSPARWEGDDVLDRAVRVALSEERCGRGGQQRKRRAGDAVAYGVHCCLLGSLWLHASERSATRSTSSGWPFR